MVKACLVALLILSSHSVCGQSKNTVKFNVGYDAPTNTYIAYLIPDYNVPNTYNTALAEIAYGAQFTLVVLKDFIVSSITDITGDWDKRPIKFGPGQPNQNWQGYGLNPSLNYYFIGMNAAGNYFGSFIIGQPVALFSFKGNGCFGPIYPLAPDDPFIMVANRAYSLNAGNSFASRSGQNNAAYQNPLEQFVDITGPWACCTLNKTCIPFSATKIRTK